MKFGMISDIHFGGKSDSPLFLEHQMQFYDHVFFPEMEKRGITTLLILGDTWDRRKYINLNTLHVVKTKFFKRLNDMGVQVKMIYGNHDVFFRNTNEVNSVDFLAHEFPNIEVIEEHKIFDFDGLKVGMISWINGANLESSLDFIRNAECRVLCGHFEIKSFEMIKGVSCDHGFDKDIFNRYERVYSGHFHVVSSDRRITYLGNPHEMNWGDYNVKKGFWIFDTETVDTEYIQSPFRTYEKIAYNDDLDILKFDYAAYNNKIVRVYIKSFEVANKKKLDLFLDKLSTAAFSCETHEINQEGTLDDDIEHVDMDHADNLSVIDQYIEGVSEGASYDKGKLKGFFLDIYNEAQERMVTVV